MPDNENAMAMAYKADAEVAQAEAARLRFALDILLPWVENFCDIYCVDPKKHIEYLNANEAMK